MQNKGIPTIFSHISFENGVDTSYLSKALRLGLCEGILDLFKIMLGALEYKGKII